MDATHRRAIPPPSTWMTALRERARDPALSVLLAVQVLVLFVVQPASAAGWRGPGAVFGTILFIVVSLAIFASHGRWTMFAGIVLLGLSATSALVNLSLPGRQTDLVFATVRLVTFCVLGYVVISAVFGPGRVNAHRIRGAVVFYINLGLIFALLHRMLFDLVPGSYDHIPPDASREAVIAALDYFSFSTLTSVGFGDILPVHPLARSLSTLEAICGQLFPATLLARIVGLEMEARRH